MHKKSISFLLSLLFIFLLMSCKNKQVPASRYYGESYNFIVDADSMLLLRYLPNETSLFQDTIIVYKGDRVAVADILSADSIAITSDTTWVQLVKDEESFGWVEEMEMRSQLVPADPISQSISFFSHSHIFVFLVIIATMAISYFLRRLYKRGAYLVHVNDISSWYPVSLTLLVSTTASLYASIQMYAFEQWQQFYYHPTLNPFAEHGIIGWFISAAWLLVIMALACVSEVKRLLPIGDAILYLLGLCAVCAADYIIFSQLTLIYIGYPLLVLYIAFAITIKIKR